eukprot:scaffold245516_cov13-Tisochrysis_lutea.AAC.1
MGLHLQPGSLAAQPAQVFQPQGKTHEKHPCCPCMFRKAGSSVNEPVLSCPSRGQKAVTFLWPQFWSW